LDIENGKLVHGKEAQPSTEKGRRWSRQRSWAWANKVHGRSTCIAIRERMNGEVACGRCKKTKTQEPCEKGRQGANSLWGMQEDRVHA
jgi:hypothetical protein